MESQESKREAPMKEYRVERDSWFMQPDPKKPQATVDKMALDGWTLTAATAVKGSRGGSVLTFWEREKTS
jgi:hypothetical protein